MNKIYRLVYHTSLFPTFKSLSTWGDQYPNFEVGSLALHIEGPIEFVNCDGGKSFGIKIATTIGIGWAYLNAYEEVRIKSPHYV